MLVYMENEILDIFNNGTWYHSVCFKDTKSKGTFDYTNLIHDLNFPSMRDLSVLDVGCSDGFFSKFFIEELNAKVVTGVDFNLYDGSVAFEVLNNNEKEYIEKYNNQNDYENLKSSYENLGLLNSNKFELLKKVFNLNMNYHYGSIYNLSGFEKHDVSFCGSLLEHLRDPITAIEQLYSVTNKFTIIDISNSLTGIFKILNKPISMYTGAGGNFFHHSEKAISLMMEAVGYKNVKLLRRYKIKIEKYGYKIPHAILIGMK